MLCVRLNPVPFPQDRIGAVLAENGICVNRYAEIFMSHPSFSTERTEAVTVVAASLAQIGLPAGATLDELFRYLPGTGLNPCPPWTGLFLRLAWRDQAESVNSVLTGTHTAPDRAVTVLSEPLEDDDAFPKGLYLRRVDGKLWLRGYICDGTYRFPPDALFAVVPYKFQSKSWI